MRYVKFVACLTIWNITVTYRCSLTLFTLYVYNALRRIMIPLIKSARPGTESYRYLFLIISIAWSCQYDPSICPSLRRWISLSFLITFRLSAYLSLPHSLIYYSYNIWFPFALSLFPLSISLLSSLTYKIVIGLLLLIISNVGLCASTCDL